MTAEGILYIDETCRDVFKKQLDKEFGKNKWRLDGISLSHIWNKSQIPPTITADVLNKETDEILGRITIENKYIQEYDEIQDSMYLIPHPSQITNIWKGE